MGIKAWYYTGIRFTTDSDGKALINSPATIYLTDDVAKRNNKSLETDVDFVSGYSIGDVLSIVNSDKLDNICKVTSVNGNAITVDSIPFTNIVSVGSGNIDIDDYTVMTTNNPYVGCISLGDYSYVMGSGNKAYRRLNMVFGRDNTSFGDYAFIGGRNNSGAYASLVAGRDNSANDWYSFAWGRHCSVYGQYSMAGGNKSSARGRASMALGESCTSSGACGFAQGFSATASGTAAHSEGNGTTAGGNYSHAEGYATTASGQNSHAEGESTIAGGRASHAEGNGSATGNYSHSGGWGSHAKGTACFVHGNNSTAATNYSCVMGFNLIASNNYEFVCGKYNDPTVQNLIFQVGNGTSAERKNALEITTGGTINILIGSDKISLQKKLKDLELASSSGIDANAIDVSASNAIDQVNAATDLETMKQAMLTFIQSFRKQ